MKDLLSKIRSCTLCSLVHGHRPVIQGSENSKIAIIGQAPGRKVHESGIPWNDPSGKNLRKWLNVTDTQFYDPEIFALIPMGFCYPGHGKNGDLPPRSECAPKWHESVMNEIKEIKIILLFGHYAQKYYLGDRLKKSLTLTVKNFKEYLPHFMPLPHPSPRNGIWLKKNLWFEQEVLSVLRQVVKDVLRRNQ